MTEDDLDKALNSRINEVFDDYTDTTADEGWALLRQKFPEKKKDRGLVWLWYPIAAMLLLGIGLWWMQKPVEDNHLVAKHDQPKIVKPGHQPSPTITPDTVLSKSPVQELVKTKAPAPISGSTPLGIKQRNQQPAFVAATSNKGKKTIVNTSQTPAGTQKNISQSTTNNIAVTPPQHIGKVDSSIAIVNNNQQVIADHSAKLDSVQQVNNVGKPAVNVIADNKQTSADAMTKLLNETKGLKEPKQGKTDRKAILSLYATTYFNYAKGSDNQLNAGAGFSSDFKISKRFRLSAGVAVGQNTLNYQGNTSTNATAALAAVTPATTALSQITAFSVVSGLRASSFVSSSAPVAQNYKANLVGLDVPVNIKYLFNPQSSDAFAAVGLSSGTFIKETYTLDYVFGKTDQQSITRNSFSTFDFAKTLNVSFGVGYPLGKSNRLIVEPFLKYPLDGLGAQQIKFGAGGINLKLNFLPAKK